MVLVFEIELVNETIGSFMNFEYEYELYGDDYSEEDIADMVEELETGRNSELYDTILSNISINPRFLHKES
jgi:uncharacterized membrane protein